MRLDSKAEPSTRMDRIEEVLVMSLRMLCLHDNELGRQNREPNELLEYEQAPIIPDVNADARTKWLSEIPEVTEDNPFPRHEEWTWKECSFAQLAEVRQTYILEHPAEAEEQK